MILDKRSCAGTIFLKVRVKKLYPDTGYSINSLKWTLSTVSEPVKGV
jgi:hypothetical protein